jgi:hypothetical protein
VVLVVLVVVVVVVVVVVAGVAEVVELVEVVEVVEVVSVCVKWASAMLTGVDDCNWNGVAVSDVLLEAQQVAPNMLNIARIQIGAANLERLNMVNLLYFGCFAEQVSTVSTVVAMLQTSN